MPYPTPHYDKITAAIENDKVPANDKALLEKHLAKYQEWIKAMDDIDPTDVDLIPKMVDVLNIYKYQVDMELIFMSVDNFLYRQKGQLKLDNTVIEEFLPRLVGKAFPNILEQAVLGPQKCFSGLHFYSTIGQTGDGGNMKVRAKDQDFAIAKRLYIRSSFDEDFARFETQATFLGYLTSECKTNLDKTMFQEANATAHDVKIAIPGARYILLCEWLDMTPISTAGTDIDEVIILRKAKRLSSNVRKHFSAYKGRLEQKDDYEKHLRDNPFDEGMLRRYLGHITEILENEAPGIDKALEEGYF